MEQNVVCTEFLYLLHMSLNREIRFSVSISLVIVPYSNEVIIHLMSNRSPMIHIKFQHCNTDDSVSFTDVWKTHWAVGHTVQSANVSGSHVSYDVNILPVNGLIQVSERHALTIL